MQRTPNVPGRVPVSAISDNPSSKPHSYSPGAQDRVGSFWDMLGFRLIFLVCSAVAGYHFRPFSLSKEWARSPVSCLRWA